MIQAFKIGENVKMKKKYWISIIGIFMLFCVLWVKPNEVKAAANVPGNVKMVSVYPSENANFLRVVWDRTSNATNYIIYVKKNGTSGWKKIASARKDSREANVSFIPGKNIEVGKDYFCTVRAYNSKTKKYGSFDKKGIKFKVLPETVSLTGISMNKAKTGIVLKWQRYDGKPIERGDFYLILKKQGTKWKQIAKVDSKTMTYTDTKFSKGKVNTYTVKSYNSKTKTKGNYDKTGLTIDLTKNAAKIVYADPHTEVILRGKVLDCSFRNVTSTIKWYSSNSAVAKVSSAGKNKGKIRGLKNGTAQITAVVGNQVRKFTVIVASGNDFVNKWTKNMASEIRKTTSDPERQLLLVSQYLVGNFQYANVYDMSTVIWEEKGNCYSAGQVMVKIYQALGYKAKVRSAIHDSKKRYPSNFFMGSDHYNVEVSVRGRIYYLDASPQSDVTYLSSKTEVLEAYFNFGTGWIRTQ